VENIGLLQHLLMLLIWLGVLTEADNTKTSDINENEQDDLGGFDSGQ
jgi:hypothetical protein